ncbi:MAG: hypothetical protein VXW09_00935 [Pseudomonadota bacterium]|nr:hypothetical protein [Pseudomonadota bacterium]
MEFTTQIRKLSLWIFIIPFVAVNLCLFVSVNHHIFENTFLTVDHIGRSNPTFPYVDGGVSISRTARTYPTYLIFKPSMIFASFLLILYWIKTNKLINNFQNLEKNNLFKTFGILSAIFLIIHSIFLGIKFDYDIYKFFRRFVLLAFIIFEIVAQSLLVIRLFKLKSLIKNYFNNYVLILKIILVTILVLVAVLSLPIVVTSGNVYFKHALEWNYFIGVILFYLLTFLFWKKN